MFLCVLYRGRTWSGFDFRAEIMAISTEKLVQLAEREEFESENGATVMFCFGQVVPRMLFLLARVKKQPVVCFATRPSVLPIPIYFMWTFVLLPISFFQ